MTVQAQTGQLQRAPRQAAPFGVFERMMAGRYLRSRRREGFISIIAGFSFLGIVLGVATLIIVMAVMNGFRNELLSKILGMSGHITVQATDTVFDDYARTADEIRGVPGVRMAMPFVDGQAMASSSQRNLGVVVRGVELPALEQLGDLARNLKHGDLEQFAEGQGLVIGIRLAQQLGLTINDQITIISPRGAVTPFGVTPRVKSYPISAIFEVGMTEIDLAFVFMPLEEAQLYFNQDGLATGIDIYVSDPDRVDAYLPDIRDAISRSVLLTDWRARNASFFTALQVERNVMFLILTLIVLVAALNIISGLIMLVKDKGRDIAVLRTMGATRGAIMRVFFMTGASIGTVGTLVGLILGVIVCLNAETIRQFIAWVSGTEVFSPEIYYLAELPADMAPGDVIAVVAMALTLSFLATLYPAWRAAKLDPVEALRYE